MRQLIIQVPRGQGKQVLDIAISPAVNDPFTAIQCIDRLSAGLSRLVKRIFPRPTAMTKTTIYA